MLADGDVIAKIAELKAKDKTLWQKIKDFLTKLVARIKAAYEGMTPDSVEGRYVAEMLDTAEKLKALWTEALVDASEAHNASDLAEIDANTESVAPTMLSERTWTESDYVIPLSERFNAETNDIRYSFRSSHSGTANDALSPYNDELTRFIQQKGDYIVDDFAKLKQIVNLAFDNLSIKATAYFGIVNEATLRKIKNSIPNLPKAIQGILFKEGLDYSIATTFDAIRHIVDDKSLSREDVIDYLDRFADTILEFDSVAFNYYAKGKDKIPALLFKKRYADGTLISFDLVSNKKRSILLQTLYMDSADYQKKKSAETLLMQNAVSNTSKTQVGQTSDNSISQNYDFVNIESKKTLHSERDPDSVSNRSLLANALESVAQNDIERKKLEEYKGKIALIESEQAKLTEIRAKIKELSFAKGKRDTDAINKLRFEEKQTANRINTYDKQLLNLEYQPKRWNGTTRFGGNVVL